PVPPTDVSQPRGPGGRGISGHHDVAIPYVTPPPPPHGFSRPAPSLVESLVDLDAPPLLGLRPHPTIGVGSRVGVTGRQRAGQETVKAKTLQSHYLYDLLNFTVSLPSPATYSLGK